MSNSNVYIENGNVYNTIYMLTPLLYIQYYIHYVQLEIESCAHRIHISSPLWKPTEPKGSDPGAKAPSRPHSNGMGEKRRYKTESEICFYSSPNPCLVNLKKHWFTDSLIHWISDSLVQWFAGSLIHRLTHSLIHWLTSSFVCWVIDSLNHRFTESLIHWIVSLICRVIAPLIHWEIADSLMSLLSTSFVRSFVHSLVHWSIDSSAQ